MGHLNVVAVLAVLFSLLVETEANPFVYNYDRLRIGGLIFAGLLVIGGLSLIFYHKCSIGNKKCQMTAVKSDIQADKPVFPKEKEELTAKGRRGSLCGGRPKTAQVVSPAQDCKIMKKERKRSHKLYIYI
eukprot:XP_011603689.1 PREDICTED: putative FXYD domain-containing ion transport regulator 8 [Takifugu rubripes]